MKGLHFDLITGLRMLAYVYALMSLALWLLFRRVSRSGGSPIWFQATAGAAVGALLFSLRGVAPDWASVHVANLLIFSAYGAAAVSLRVEVGLPSSRGVVVSGVVLMGVVFELAALHSVGLRMQVGAAGHALGASLLAWTGMHAARVTTMQSVRLIGGAYTSYALTLLVLALATRADVTQPQLISGAPDFAVLFALLAGTASGVYGTLGYIGMAMERLRHSEIEQATEVARQGAQRAAAEQNALQLQRWLDERDDLVRILAHEVRQPLNNASAALQSARAALAPPVESERRTQPAAVEQRVQRAQSVLGQVIGSLDNTLAATALLASPDRVARHDADVDLLLQLSVGDLDAAQAARVQVQRLSHTRTATMDAGLMRLALRNLLNNALSYSDPQHPVQLRVSDSDDPLALVFEVLDRGPGVDPDLASRLFQRGERGDHEQPGHGLGLYVVQRVAQLHSSRVDVLPREGGGSIFRFWLTQGL